MECEQFDGRNFALLARSMTGRAGRLNSIPQERRFRACFGVSPDVCSAIWSRLGSKKLENCDPIHLLWCLLFLKVYSTEDVLATIAGVDRKTYRKWTWPMITALSNLNMVRYYGRLISRVDKENYSLTGTGDWTLDYY